MYKILTKSPLFKGLNEIEIEKVLNSVKFKIKSYEQYESINFRGDRYEELYIIISGSVIGEMLNHSGKVMIVENITAPFPIAPAFLFGNNNNLPINIVANEKLKLLVIPKSSILKMANLNEIFLRNYLNIVCNKASFLAKQLWNNTMNSSLKGKLADYLLTVSKNRAEFELPISLTKLSDFFGVPRPSLSRVFSSLVKDEIIEKIDRKKIKILDREKLLEI
ncbi:Crp/Fnr family transcriptional regulator [Haliovirga abyssi]|uniref:Crp/Fnr family transcriptional regulator n=1 Tax=Haliovirga abyssi TaxID=2996794 RepID=A0AAU9DES7_9FUSO|nr:Crp/Fnr family transcriptional regulator [Haliovirga abyssi]BDU49852.1 Crp/Fnr family transcriptional regulator [Haliovirga abyssi]